MNGQEILMVLGWTLPLVALVVGGIWAGANRTPDDRPAAPADGDKPLRADENQN